MSNRFAIIGNKHIAAPQPLKLIGNIVWLCACLDGIKSLFAVQY